MSERLCNCDAASDLRVLIGERLLLELSTAYRSLNLRCLLDMSRLKKSAKMRAGLPLLLCWKPLLWWVGHQPPRLLRGHIKEGLVLLLHSFFEYRL